jgi:uncharacterized protein (DUF924 family)
MPTTLTGTNADRVDAILKFWLEDTKVEQWYQNDGILDGEIKYHFMADYRAAAEGKLRAWEDDPRGSLALLILLDQFARNMFRGSPRSFAQDDAARRIARHALDQGFEAGFADIHRQFFIMPLMHSEALADQDACIAMFEARMENADNSVLHAKVHREIIRRFGRFPYRNEALGRTTTQEEQEFLDAGGYSAILKEIQAA